MITNRIEVRGSHHCSSRSRWLSVECKCVDLGFFVCFFVRAFASSHRAMFKLGAKIVFLLCLLVKNMSAVYSADRCNSEESDNAVQDLYGIGGDISAERAHKPEHFGHFRFPIPVPNWQFWIKVWTYVIGLPCSTRTMLTYQKVRQVWTLQYGHTGGS